METILFLFISGSLENMPCLDQATIIKMTSFCRINAREVYKLTIFYFIYTYIIILCHLSFIYRTQNFYSSTDIFQRFYWRNLEFKFLSLALQLFHFIYFYILYLWVPISLTGKIFYIQIKDLEFDPHLHQKSISVSAMHVQLTFKKEKLEISFIKIESAQNI